MKLTTILMIIVFTRASLVMADLSPKLGLPWCMERKVSLDKKQLECLKSLEESKIVRRGFNEILQRHKNCPKCKSVVVEEEKYLSLYHFPFLVMAVNFSTQGSGVEVHIVFKEGPAQEFVAFLDLNDGTNVNELTVINAIDPSKEMAKLTKKLREKEFEQFWIER